MGNKISKVDGQYILFYKNEEYLMGKDYDWQEEIDPLFIEEEDFERRHGVRIAVTIDGDTFTIQKRQQKTHERKNRARQGKGKIAKGKTIPVPASAPYNFVGLPKKRHPNFDFHFAHHHYHPKLHHGYIDLEITTLTPLMIRGQQEDFFKIQGSPCIPGSSLRGLISTMVEIISGGAFQQFNNRRIYQRAMFPDGTSANDYYEEKRPDTKAGFLKFDKRRRLYLLRTDSEITLKYTKDKKRKAFTIIYHPQNFTFEINSGKMDKKVKVWQISTQIPFPELEAKNLLAIPKADVQNYQDDKDRDIPDQVNPLALARKLALNQLKKSTLTEAYHRYGIPVFYAEYTDDQGNTRYSFGHTKNYRIPYHKKISDHIPADFLDEEKQFMDFRKALFGYTKAEFTPPPNSKFPTECAGKLQFEGLFLQASTDEDFLPTEIAKILGNPKVSYYPAYLKQDPLWTRTPLNSLKHWGSDKSQIRGYKLYHHINRPEHWINEDIRMNVEKLKSYFSSQKVPYKTQDHIREDLGIDRTTTGYFNIKKRFSQFHPETQRAFHAMIFNEALSKNAPLQFTLLRPLKAGRTFRQGRIRFANLSNEELGLLLLAIELDGQARHKIGYAKPYGLGSIHLQIKNIQLHNRQQRYQQVFDNQQQLLTGALPPGPTQQRCEAAKQAFYAFYNCSTAEAFWQLPHNHNLARLLNWNPERQAQEEWIEATRYMPFPSEQEKQRIGKEKKPKPANGFREKRVLRNLNEFFESK